MNLPNKLTILRIILVPVILIALYLPLGIYGRWISAVMFLGAAFTDTLDGYIARKNNLVTNFGKFMDPLADKLLICSVLIALIELGDINSIAVIIIIAREFIITGFRLVAVEQNVVIAADIFGKIKTIVQTIMVFVVLLDIPAFYYLEQVLIFLSVLFTIISAVNYIVKNKDVLVS